MFEIEVAKIVKKIKGWNFFEITFFYLGGPAPLCFAVGLSASNIFARCRSLILGSIPAAALRMDVLSVL